MLFVCFLPDTGSDRGLPFRLRQLTGERLRVRDKVSFHKIRFFKIRFHKIKFLKIKFHKIRFLKIRFLKIKFLLVSLDFL